MRLPVYFLQLYHITYLIVFLTEFNLRRNLRMNRAKASKFAYFAAILLGIGLVFAPGLTSQNTVFAQDVAETPTAEQPTPTVPGATPTVPAATPTVPGATPTVPGATVTATPDASNPTPVNPTSTPISQPPQPVPIPEPITVVLFGTGLAALSAAVAARRKKE